MFIVEVPALILKFCPSLIVQPPLTLIVELPILSVLTIVPEQHGCDENDPQVCVVAFKFKNPLFKFTVPDVFLLAFMFIVPPPSIVIFEEVLPVELLRKFIVPAAVVDIEPFTCDNALKFTVATAFKFNAVTVILLVKFRVAP
jgi:hypothetical protein